MTTPPDGDMGWPAEPPRGRHASPSGSYLPPLPGSDPDLAETAFIPAVIDEAEPGEPEPAFVTPEAALLSAPAEPVAYPEPEPEPAYWANEPMGYPGPQPAGEPIESAVTYAEPAPAYAEPEPAYHVSEPQPARQSAPGGSSALRLVWIYPDLLSTYGDRGNLIVLARRARLRGIDVEAIEVNSDQPVPQQGDIYLLGGGEDLPQILAAQRLRADGGLNAAASAGAVIFAVCAGYQLIGSVFGGSQGEPVDGLGILDIGSGRGERRGVGEVVADVDPALGLDRLTGFENHQGVTRPGPGARPLARTLAGVGNGDGTEGAYSGRILGTYLHGPALVRNPGLADLLLSWAVGMPLAPLPDPQETLVRQLRAERLAAVPA